MNVLDDIPAPGKKARDEQVFVFRPDRSSGKVGVQGQFLVPCVTQDTCGANGISAGMIYMPPNAQSSVHYHARTELVVMCLQGWAATLIGIELQPYFHGPGEILYIPAGIVHCAVNLSDAELTAVEMRTDPAFNDDVVGVPELQDTAREHAELLRAEFSRSGHGQLAERT